MLQELLAAMQAALSFGLQWEELAVIAVTALERWEVQQPKVLSEAEVLATITF